MTVNSMLKSVIKLIRCDDYVAFRLIDEGLDLRSIESEYELDIATIHPENHFVYQVLMVDLWGLPNLFYRVIRL